MRIFILLFALTLVCLNSLAKSDLSINRINDDFRGKNKTVCAHKLMTAQEAIAAFRKVDMLTPTVLRVPDLSMKLTFDARLSAAMLYHSIFNEGAQRFDHQITVGACSRPDQMMATFAHEYAHAIFYEYMHSRIHSSVAESLSQCARAEDECQLRFKTETQNLVIPFSELYSDFFASALSGNPNLMTSELLHYKSVDLETKPQLEISIKLRTFEPANCSLSAKARDNYTATCSVRSKIWNIMQKYQARCGLDAALEKALQKIIHAMDLFFDQDFGWDKRDPVKIRLANQFILTEFQKVQSESCRTRP